MMHYEYLAYHLQRARDVEARLPKNTVRTKIIVEFKDKLNLRKRKNPRRIVESSNSAA